jgi:hypothetical protein
MPLTYQYVVDQVMGAKLAIVVRGTQDRRVSGKNQWAMHRNRDGDFRLTAATIGMTYKASVGLLDYYEAVA